ncbi:TRAP transporter small permease [Tuberibacillus sp. Marseille-P3662]|uniref:TRAP transporter small permease n=1 Tax=Tuberibacillus sp. Marseille-P3662 TaxID=1965358 RepID=UPI000A1CD2CC|nr:TRAP transporter small permease [Tuberibacillus sp. Marseille-P3662]
MFRLIFKYINLLSDVLAGLSSVCIFIVVILQVIGRLIGYPFPWTVELTRFLFIWLIFLGISIGFRKAESPRVTFLINYLPLYFNKIAVWIYAIASIGFFLFMLYSGIQLTLQQWTVNETSSALQLPMWIIGMSIPFAALTGVLNVVQSLLYDKEIIKKGG